MKIAHFPGSFLPHIGGVEMAVHNIALHQINMGHNVHIIVPFSAYWKLKAYKSKLLYNVLPILPKTFSILRFIKSRFNIEIYWIINLQVYLLQRNYKFDIWHFNLINELALYIIPYLKKTNVPTIGTFRGSDIQLYPELDYGWRRNPEFNKKVKNIIHDFSLLTAISKSVFDEYKSLGVNDEKIVLVPNGCDYNRITKFSINKNNFYQKYNIPYHTKIILSVGRNHPKKGFTLIPSIISELKKVIDKNGFIWILVGRGNNEIYLKAKKMDVHKHLLVVPEVLINKSNLEKLEIPPTTIIEYYRSADIFCFPTIVETFGNIFLEAMAAGVPIVTTDAPGARDIITHEYNGLVSPTNSVAVMAKNIARVLKDKTIRENLIKNGLSEIKQYSWSRIVQKYENVYLKAKFIKQYR